MCGALFCRPGARCRTGSPRGQKLLSFPRRSDVSSTVSSFERILNSFLHFLYINALLLTDCCDVSLESVSIVLSITDFRIKTRDLRRVFALFLNQVHYRSPRILHRWSLQPGRKSKASSRLFSGRQRSPTHRRLSIYERA